MLYLVATPIGNLGDLTLRALEVLKEADIIAAEDTRHSSILLRHYGIQKPLISYHEHNEAMRTAELLARLRNGENVAVITDAGTPSISDPGRRLLQACIDHALPYTVLPGPSAVLTALAGSGFPAEQFHFAGFLPTKSSQREREVLAAGQRECTSIFFESPHRLVKTLSAFAEKAPDRVLCVARELTKQFEEYRLGTGSELSAHYIAHPPKGEIVLLVKGLTRREARALSSESQTPEGGERHRQSNDF
jgi:16S rRNA (cytidine1402-2'-O)-methyltransferase